MLAGERAAAGGKLRVAQLKGGQRWLEPAKLENVCPYGQALVGIDRALSSLPREAGQSAADASFRFFMDRAPLMMGTVALLPDGDLLHVYDNAATTRFFGVQPHETEGRTARQLGAPEAVIAMWRQRYEDAARQGESVAFEYVHEHSSGLRLLAVTVSALDVQAEEGAPLFSYIADDVTERRASEMSLRASEAALRGVFEQAAIGLAMVDLDGRWLRVNRRLSEMLGYTEDELAALTFQDISHPDDLAADMAHVKALLDGETATYVMEKRYFRRDGSTMWAQLTVSLLRMPEGEPERFISVIEDISARKAAEASLTLAERRLAMATHASGLGVWEWVFGQDAVHYSARAREICGFPPDRPVTLPEILQSVHDDDRERVAASAARPRRPHDEPATLEYRVVRPGGEVRWVRAFSTVVAERTGSPDSRLRLFGTLDDITGQREMIDRLAASEARLHLALDAGRMAVFEWPLDDPEPPLTPELRRQLGIADEEPSTVEQRRERYHAEDAAMAASTRQQALESDERFLDFSFRYHRPDGQQRWLQVRSEIVRDEAARPARLVGVQMDVTEERENAERLRLLMREVDHRANNLLAVVQSLVSLSRADDVAGYREVLEGRIQALARAHRLLAEARWTGADLVRLVEEELRPFGVNDGDRIMVKGPAVSLAPAQAQALSLCLHELATNAVKYGALSAPHGRLSVEWRHTAGQLTLLWIELGGPPARAPLKSGFGMTLLSRSLGGPIGGAVDLAWAATGLSATVTLPLP